MKRNGLKGRSARKGAFRRKVMRIWRCDILDYTLDCGPVAQLGARFHGMEEVDGSNPSRSTKIPHRLTGTIPYGSSSYPFGSGPIQVQNSDLVHSLVVVIRPRMGTAPTL